MRRYLRLLAWSVAPLAIAAIWLQTLTDGDLFSYSAAHTFQGLYARRTWQLQAGQGFLDLLFDDMHPKTRQAARRLQRTEGFATTCTHNGVLWGGDPLHVFRTGLTQFGAWRWQDQNEIDVTEHGLTIDIPYWLPLLLSCIPVFLAARRPNLTPPGLCPKCRYDLRASPIRCPECGHPVQADPNITPLAQHAAH